VKNTKTDISSNQDLLKYFKSSEKYPNYYKIGNSYYIYDSINHTGIFYKKDLTKMINELKTNEILDFYVNLAKFRFTKGLKIITSTGKIEKCDLNDNIIGYQCSPNNISRNVYEHNICRNYSNTINDKKYILEYLENKIDLENDDFKKHILNRFYNSGAYIKVGNTKPTILMSDMKSILKSNKSIKISVIKSDFQTKLFRTYVENYKETCKIKILCHGTRPEGYNNISKEHFNPSYSSNGLCGNGLYFSYSALYSHSFVEHYLRLKCKSLFICAVAYNTEIKSIDLFSIKQQCKNYDCVSLNNGGAGMKCVPNAFQVLPLYKIDY
jgi:hypothetical protein